MEKDIPKLKIEDLKETARTWMREVIRELCTQNGLYKVAHKEGIGLEMTEECIESLMNTGDLKLFIDDENGVIILKKWSKRHGEYV